MKKTYMAPAANFVALHAEDNLMIGLSGTTKSGDAALTGKKDFGQSGWNSEAWTEGEAE